MQPVRSVKIRGRANENVNEVQVCIAVYLRPELVLDYPFDETEVPSEMVMGTVTPVVVVVVVVVFLVGSLCRSRIFSNVDMASVREEKRAWRLTTS